MMRQIVVGTLALGLAWIAVGCPAKAPPPAPEPIAVAPTPTVTMLFVHRVNFSGQTLSSIAKWYTGEAANWRKLTEPVNTGLTECCAKLRVGRVIYLPRDLVVQTKPMPFPRTVTRPAKPLRKAEPPAAAAEEPAPKADPEKVELPDDAPVEGQEPAAEPTAPPAEEEEEEILGPR